MRENDSGHATFDFEKLLRFDGKTYENFSANDPFDVLSIHAVLLANNFLMPAGNMFFFLGPPTKTIDIPMTSIKAFDFKHKTLVFDKKS